MKFLHVAQFIDLNNLLKFHKISFSGLFYIMGQKTLVWSLRYDPTQHQIDIDTHFEHFHCFAMNWFTISFFAELLYGIVYSTKSSERPLELNV